MLSEKREYFFLGDVLGNNSFHQYTVGVSTNDPDALSVPVGIEHASAKKQSCRRMPTDAAEDFSKAQESTKQKLFKLMKVGFRWARVKAILG